MVENRRDPRDPLAGPYRPVPHRPASIPPLEAAADQRRFLARMQERRTVRAFSTAPVDIELVERAIETAGTAPSGAHAQPWTFVIVSDAETKARIRAAAEAEEQQSYAQRMPEDWLAALERLGTDDDKAHLTDAPHLVIVFGQHHYLDSDTGYTRKHYYVTESVGISVGLLLASLHLAGLATLTHTPSPMRFLTDICGRPANERPFVVIPVGHPAEDATVPDIERKTLDEIRVRPPAPEAY